MSQAGGYWEEHIQEWANNKGKDPLRQKNILIADGWEPDKYQPSMKKALFDYLDKWHTLHIKNMPKPATLALKKNPSQSVNICPHYEVYCTESFLGDDEIIWQMVCDECEEVLKSVRGSYSEDSPPLWFYDCQDYQNDYECDEYDEDFDEDDPIFFVDVD